MNRATLQHLCFCMNNSLLSESLKRFIWKYLVFVSRPEINLKSKNVILKFLETFFEIYLVNSFLQLQEKLLLTLHL